MDSEPRRTREVPIDNGTLNDVKRLYVEEKLSLKSISERFHIHPRRLARELASSGVSIRQSLWNAPKGRPAKPVCDCGKPVDRNGRCTFHAQMQEHEERRQYARRNEVQAMCERLEKVVMARSGMEAVGIVADRRLSRYGRTVAYFWQGSHDRSPEWKRRLGSVPERVSMRASRMLLKALQAARRRVSDGSAW